MVVGEIKGIGKATPQSPLPFGERTKGEGKVVSPELLCEFLSQVLVECLEEI